MKHGVGYSSATVLDDFCAILSIATKKNSLNRRPRQCRGILQETLYSKAEISGLAKIGASELGHETKKFVQ